METGRENAKQIFDSLGFDVEQIPEDDEERADLIVRDAETCFIIENKDKEDVPLSDDQQQSLERGEVVSGADRTTQNNRIAGIFTKARDQLDATPADEGAFRVIWFHADGMDRQLIWDRAFATFYGKVDLLPRDEVSNDIIHCYYFDYATSFSIPTVDALILSDGRSLQLLLNEFSENADRIKETALFNVFASGGAVVDPRELETKDQILTFRHDMPRKDDKERLSAMESDTGKRYHVVRFMRHTVSVLSSPPKRIAK